MHQASGQRSHLGGSDSSCEAVAAAPAMHQCRTRSSNTCKDQTTATRVYSRHSKALIGRCLPRWGAAAAAGAWPLQAGGAGQVAAVVGGQWQAGRHGRQPRPSFAAGGLVAGCRWASLQLGPTCQHSRLTLQEGLLHRRAAPNIDLFHGHSVAAICCLVYNAAARVQASRRLCSKNGGGGSTAAAGPKHQQRRHCKSSHSSRRAAARPRSAAHQQSHSTAQCMPSTEAATPSHTTPCRTWRPRPAPTSPPCAPTALALGCRLQG